MAEQQQKDYVKKVIIEDAGDGSVSVHVRFEDGSEYFDNQDPCICAGVYDEEKREYVIEHETHCTAYEEEDNA